VARPLTVTLRPRMALASRYELGAVAGPVDEIRRDQRLRSAQHEQAANNDKQPASEQTRLPYPGDARSRTLSHQLVDKVAIWAAPYLIALAAAARLSAISRSRITMSWS